MKRFLQIFYALFLVLLISGCKKDKPDIIVYDVEPHLKKYDEDQQIKNVKASKSYHTDTTYKYDYRTGESGNYRYHYKVVGKNSKGEDVAGEVDMDGKFGSGTLKDQTKIEAEWVDKGEIEATDSQGNVYELIVE